MINATQLRYYDNCAVRLDTPWRRVWVCPEDKMYLLSYEEDRSRAGKLVFCHSAGGALSFYSTVGGFL